MRSAIPDRLLAASSFRPVDLLYLLAAALSGFSGLVYEVVWERLLRIHFGGDATSSFLIVTSFLLGLGVGSYVLRDVRAHPAQRYGLLELTLGLVGLSSHAVLANVPYWIKGALHLSLDDAGLFHVVLGASTFALVMVPAALVGGTLPLMSRAFQLSAHSAVRYSGLLYGSNTLGASLAIAVTPLFLLSRFTLSTTLKLTACINLTLGVIFLVVGRRTRLATEPVEALEPASVSTGPASFREHRGVIGPVVASGALVLAWELVLFRAFNDIDPLSPYNFPLVLFLHLGALATGSLVASRRACASTGDFRRFAGIAFPSIAVVMLVGVETAAAIHSKFLPISFRTYLVGGEFRLGYFVAYTGALTLPVGLLLGGIYPTAAGVAAGSSIGVSRSLGFLGLLGTVGAVTAGTLMQFVAIPTVGLSRSVIAIYLATVTYAWTLIRESGSRGRVSANVLLAVLAVLPFAVVRPGHWRLFSTATTDGRAEVVEGPSGVARIDWGWGLDGSPFNDASRVGAVFVNNHYMSQLPDHPKHVALEGIVLAIPNRSRVLVLGLGGGRLVRQLADDSLVAHVMAVDWSGELIRLLDGKARSTLGDLVASPRVRIVQLDARIALQLLPEDSADVVVDNLAQAHWAGATHVKSIEYLRMVRRVLGPRGTFVFDSNEAPRETVAALHHTFENILYDQDLGVFVCSAAPIEFDLAMAERFLARRGDQLQPPHPGIEFYRDRFRPIDPATLEHVTVATDDDLSMEYPRQLFVR